MGIFKGLYMGYSNLYQDFMQDIVDMINEVWWVMDFIDQILILGDKIDFRDSVVIQVRGDYVVFEKID